MLTDFQEIQEAFADEKIIALDLETTGLSPWNDNIAVIAMYAPESETPALLHYPRGHKVPESVLRWLESFELIITHNGTQFDILFLACTGMDVTKVQWYDTLIGEQAVIAVGRRDVRVNLQDTVKRRLGKVLNKDIDHRTWQNEHLTQEQLDYVAGDIVNLYDLRQAQLEKAAADTSGNMMRGLEFEQSLVPAVVAMELNGLPVNVAKLELYVEGSVDAKGTEEEWLWNRWEQEIKLTSPKALKAFLNDRYPNMFPDTQAGRLMEYTRMGGQLGEEMQHLLNFRHADQRRKMFSQSWIDQYVVYHSDGVPRLHGKFWQIGTDTGRFCVTGDTPVECPRDMTKYPDGIPISEIHPGQLIYSFTWDKKLCIRPVKWVGITGEREIIEITLESKWRGDTRTLRITPDHLVRTARGEWVHAGNLQIGQKVMSMPRRRPVEGNGYVVFGANAERYGLNTKTQGKVYEHRWVYSETHKLSRIPAHHDVHHVDGNSLNNSPSNLELMPKSRHMSHHAQNRKRGEKRRSWDDVNEMNKLQRAAGGTGYRVVSIKPAGTEVVWDLEVEDTHTFIGAGIALHNSSSQPNLQQMPRDSREIFGPMKGVDLVVGSSDYAAIEVRVAAALSGDRAMIDAFNAGEDIHTLVASESFDVPKEAVTYEQRRIAKAISFTFLFGGGFETFLAYASSNGSTIDRDMGREAMDRFFERFHGIAEMRRTADYRCSTGRPMPIIYPTGLKRMLVGADLRPSVLLNNVVQGTAAAGLKMALKRIHDAGYSHYLCAVVHDEIVYAAPGDKIDEVKEVVQDCMIEGMFDALADCDPVAIAVESITGNSWAGDPETEQMVSKPPRTQEN